MVFACLVAIIKIFGINIIEFAYGMLAGMWLTILIIMTLLKINDRQR
jgi:hypothetical protein